MVGKRPDTSLSGIIEKATEVGRIISVTVESSLASGIVGDSYCITVIDSQVHSLKPQTERKKLRRDIHRRSASARGGERIVVAIRGELVI